jgi:hypothetical protein
MFKTMPLQEFTSHYKVILVDASAVGVTLDCRLPLLSVSYLPYKYGTYLFCCKDAQIKNIVKKT